MDSFIGTCAAKRAGVPAVISVHFDRPAYMAFPLPVREPWRLIQILKNMNADHFLPITENVGAELAQREGVPRAKMTVVAPGSPVFPAPSAEQKVAMRKKLAVPDGKILILAIGRLSHEKGMDILIDAFAKLRQTQPNALLWILGDGSEKDHLSDLIKTQNLEETVKLLGYRADARDLLSACDFFALASRAEPFGLAAVEAMMCQRATIGTAGTAGTGLATIIVDNKTGILVPPDDVDALAAAMTKLAQDSSLRDAFGAGRARAVQLFTDETMAKPIASVYRSIV